MLLLINEVKFDGLNIADSFLILRCLFDLNVKLILLILASDFKIEKKSTYTLIFLAGITAPR